MVLEVDCGTVERGAVAGARLAEVDFDALEMLMQECPDLHGGGLGQNHRDQPRRHRNASCRRRSSNWWIKTGRCEDNEVEAMRAARLKSMPTSSLSVVIQHLRASLSPESDGMTDGELLARFVRSRDEDALAALVRRHASMVWGVCRRLLHHHDAEDAFQATFLVLVRRAADVPGQAIANWLYGVARQTAVRLRATAAKRGRRETQVVTMPEPTVPEVCDADLQRVVDEELSYLPEHYRGVIVLCDLEGMTRKAAARQLGIPEGSVASRLARARAMLAKRLAQRGVVFSGGSVAAILSGSASASAPPALVASTIKAASLLAAGQAAGVVTAKVAALTEGVVKAMFVTKIKSVLAVVLVVGLVLGGVGAGVGLPTHPATAVAQQPVQPDDKSSVTRDKEKKDTKKQEKPKPDVTTADMLMRAVLVDDTVAGALKRAVLAEDKEKKDKKGFDRLKMLPGEYKRELNLGVVLRVKLVKLDTKAMLMTADVEPTKDVINPKTPLRMANLPLAVASVTDGKKELKLTDLKPGNILRLQLESWKTDGEAMAVTYIRVEDDGTAKKPDEKEKPKEDKK
jgi:RNA polymerase sigma factor (sigma-70 family)